MTIRGSTFTAILALVASATACASAPGADSPTASGSLPASPSAAASAPEASGAAETSRERMSASPGPSASERATEDPLLAATMVDVRSGETFTLAELLADGPVVVETMAIWCTNCRSQMHEVTAAHELAEFHSVSIDVEPSEVAGDLADYAGREGFDWPFVLADAALATQLRDRFGTEVLFPPGMPKLLIRPDGSIELLPLGELLTAAEIAALVDG